MGRITFSRAELNGTLGDLVGYKAGLALTIDQLAEHVDSDYSELILGEPDDIVTIRSEDAEELVAQLLYGVGLTRVRRRVASRGIDVFHKVKKISGGAAAYSAFQRILLAAFKEQESASGPFDFTRVLLKAHEELGDLGARIALMYLEGMQLSFEQSPWTQIRRVQWTNVAQLDDLFQSESLEPKNGAYIDQRYIDYLGANFQDIDRINWRKFEALTCEFFERSGYKVEIAEGRNDGGIDARIWKTPAEATDPPTILVQCKRQKAKIEKVIVKALWADVVHEGAESGLVVTTSSLSPGAEAVCAARAYPVSAANRKTVRDWIEILRTPNTGVFLGI